MTSYVKIGTEWCIASAIQHEPGSTIPVTTRAGKVKQVTLGDMIGQRRGDFIFAIAATAAPASQVIGDLSRINALFDAATASRTGRRLPSIVFADYRINVAGDRAREPGSLTITSTTERNERGQRKWMGRITKAGVFEPARDCAPTIGDQLRAFAIDPAAVAARHGQITKSCCFCNRNLTDPRSRAVGYGPDCAGHFGLPWGASDPGNDAEAEMVRMEIAA